ncbi:MAG: isoprenylcysteine carboxylmethyltransferase family protein [Chloroflexota bacterium]
MDKHETDIKFTSQAIIGFTLYLFLTPLIYFLSAGMIKNVMAWAYFGLAIFMAVVSRIVAHKKHPDTIRERARYQQVENVKDWDKTLGPVVAIYGPPAMVIVAGLDRRFGWSGEIPLGLQVGAFTVGLLGYVLGVWAMLENRFFSARVRIQSERDHTVCTTGPYRFVRHPRYAGGILYFLVTPFILSSWWTFIPAVLNAMLTGIRTALEDKALQEELNGYRAYTQQTPYRLLPGIW